MHCKEVKEGDLRRVKQNLSPVDREFYVVTNTRTGKDYQIEVVYRKGIVVWDSGAVEHDELICRKEEE